MKQTPDIARFYLLLAALLIALPTIGTFYKGATGKFLVASESINGSYFGQSVVYIVHHDLFSAFGIVVNRPLNAGELKVLSKAVKNHENIIDGGPVNRKTLRALVYNPATHDTPQVLNFSREKKQDMSAREFMAEARSYPEHLFFLGSAGWGPLQLEFEMLRGRWNTAPATPAQIFDSDRREQLWPELQENHGVYEYEWGRV